MLSRPMNKIGGISVQSKQSKGKRYVGKPVACAINRKYFFIS